ncbi:MAG: CRISPR-associated protein Cas5 [Acidilobaceae archaeon]
MKRFDAMLKEGRAKKQTQLEAKPAEPKRVEERRAEPPAARQTRVMAARVELHWGFVVRLPGASAAQLSLPLAPPTTVVGAFSAALFRLLGLRDRTAAERRVSETTLSPYFECARRSTIAASMGLAPLDAVKKSGAKSAGLCVHQEVSRLNASPYKTGGSWSEALRQPRDSMGFYSEFLTEAMPVQAVGAAYGPGSIVDLVWVFDAAELASCLSGEGARVSVEDIDSAGLKAAWSVSRLGSKEGIVSVIAASYLLGGFEERGAGEVVYTHLYVPVKCATPVYGAASTVKLWGLGYEFYDVYAPTPSSNTLAIALPSTHLLPGYRVSRECLAFSFELDGEKLAVLAERPSGG